LPAIAPESAAVRLFERATEIDLDGITEVKLPGILTVPPAVFPRISISCERDPK
jgi:hypothetical protein